MSRCRILLTGSLPNPEPCRTGILRRILCRIVVMVSDRAPRPRARPLVVRAPRRHRALVPWRIKDARSCRRRSATSARHGVSWHSRFRSITAIIPDVSHVRRGTSTVQQETPASQGRSRLPTGQSPLAAGLAFPGSRRRLCWFAALQGFNTEKAEDHGAPQSPNESAAREEPMTVSVALRPPPRPP